MKSIASVRQIQHFSQFDWLEFGELLTAEECAQISASIRQTTARRLGVPLRVLPRQLPENLYKSSRDCWREDPSLEKRLCTQDLASLAASLVNKTLLQIACDQWVPSETLLASRLSLQFHLGFQPLICGCLISLEGENAGAVRFFKPHRLPLFAGSQLLIAYGLMPLLYIHNANDLLNPLPRNLGYSFGDRLTTNTHPLTVL